MPRFHIADWLFVVFNCFEPVQVMIVALIQMDLSGLYFRRSNASRITVNKIAADIQFAFCADKADPETSSKILMFHDHSVFIDHRQVFMLFGIWRVQFYRARSVHAQSPLSNIDHMCSPIAENAATIFSVIA